MHCWHRLNLYYKDVLKIPKDKLYKQIIENQSYYTGENYVLFFIRTNDVFNKEFISFLESKNLLIMPFSVGFLVDPFSKGFVHTDYYSGMSPEISMKGVPYMSELTEHQISLLTKENTAKNWHASLHLNVGSSGMLEWYTGDSPEKFEKTKLNIPLYRHDNEDSLVLIDKLESNGISICRTDVLHRSNNNRSKDRLRVVITARFAGNPTYEELKEKLGDLVVERE